MTKTKQHQHVLVTGTSTGIGRACAIRLAAHGYIVSAGIRSDSDARSLTEEAKEANADLRPLHLDVTDAASIAAAEKQLRSQVGKAGLHGLINNAGICLVGPVEFISPDDWRSQFEVNLFGAIAMIQAMLPMLRQNAAQNPRNAPRIVNMGSITGEISTALFAPYSASKFALRAMNDALRLELRAQGIHVSLIVPGTIQSEIWRKERACVDAIAANLPARRIYGRLIDNVARYVFACADKAIPADRVAQVVERCFTVARPKIQYRVGWEAHVGYRAKQFIPDRLFDFLLGRTLGIPRRTTPPITSPAINSSPIRDTIEITHAGDSGG